MNKPIDHSSSFARDPMRSLARAALARAMCRVDRSIKPEEFAAKHWEFDDDARLILRAATAPHSMTDTSALVQVVAAVLPMLYPQSAAAQLFNICPKVTLGPESGGVTVPSAGLVPVAFVAEGAAKPVVQGLTSGARLDPHKIAGITVASSELFATANAEAFMQSMLAESAGPALDAVVFSDAAASAAAPAGLLNGLSAIPADSGAGKSDAMIADLAALGGAIGPIAGAGPVAIVTNLAQTLSLLFRSGGTAPNISILTTGALPPGTVVAVAGNAVASAMGVPEFDTNTQTTLSMNDSATAWPGGPVSSMFQTASVAIKMILNVSWARRSNSGVAYMTGVAW